MTNPHVPFKTMADPRGTSRRPMICAELLRLSETRAPVINVSRADRGGEPFFSLSPAQATLLAKDLMSMVHAAGYRTVPPKCQTCGSDLRGCGMMAVARAATKAYCCKCAAEVIIGKPLFVPQEEQERPESKLPRHLRSGPPRGGKWRPNDE